MKKRNKIILFFLFIFIGTLQARKDTTEKEIREPIYGNTEMILLNMGMQNLPNYFYNHYYRYPENVRELYSFVSNHYDYVNESNEVSKLTVSYLKENEKDLNIISQRGLFIIFQGGNLSYNNDDVCNIIALHSPETSYMEYKININLYDFKGRNLREIIGAEKTDSVISVFRKMKKDIHTAESVNYYPEKNYFVKFDKQRIVLLKYSFAEGLQTYCPNESLIISDYPFFEKLDGICEVFCKQQKINSMIFTSAVLKIYNSAE